MFDKHNFENANRTPSMIDRVAAAMARGRTPTPAVAPQGRHARKRDADHFRRTPDDSVSNAWAWISALTDALEDREHDDDDPVLELACQWIAYIEVVSLNALLDAPAGMCAPAVPITTVWDALHDA